MVEYFLLTGDIGGTNSRMALYSIDSKYNNNTTNNNNDKTKPMIEKYYRNAEHILPEFYNDPHVFENSILIPFLQYCFETNQDNITKYKLPSITNDDSNTINIIATLAVAGFVLNNQVHLTNLGNIVINGTQIMTNIHANKYLKLIVQCHIINDFVAQGYGCLTLQPNEVRCLYGPYTNEQITTLPIGPKVCIGAGTGLGECYLTPNTTNSNNNNTNQDVSYTCYASEGGHVEYAPRNDIEIQMYEYIKKKFNSPDRISIERIVSGKGLANVYEFLAYQYPNQIIQSIHEQFLIANDEQGRVVAQNVMNCTLCQQAMSIMMSAYGCETGSVAIKFIPTGGLFVTGGLTPKNIQYMDGIHTEFMKSYMNKGRVTNILNHIPLYAVMVEDLGVRGAHKAAIMEYESYIVQQQQKDKKKSFSSKLNTTLSSSNSMIITGSIVTIAIAFGSMVLLRTKR